VRVLEGRDIAVGPTSATPPETLLRAAIARHSTRETISTSGIFALGSAIGGVSATTLTLILMPCSHAWLYRMCLAHQDEKVLLLEPRFRASFGEDRQMDLRFGSAHLEE
jgi:hypothetical protein